MTSYNLSSESCRESGKRAARCKGGKWRWRSGPISHPTLLCPCCSSPLFVLVSINFCHLQAIEEMLWVDQNSNLLADSTVRAPFGSINMVSLSLSLPGMRDTGEDNGRMERWGFARKGSGSSHVESWHELISRVELIIFWTNSELTACCGKERKGLANMKHCYMHNSIVGPNMDGVSGHVIAKDAPERKPIARQWSRVGNLRVLIL